MKSKDEIAAELEAHMADLTRFDAEMAKYVPKSADEAKAHGEDIAAYHARHAAKTADLKAELG